MSIKGDLFSLASYFIGIHEEKLKEFESKKEEARKLYWDACKYPRKKKKKIRKKVKADFELYSILSQPILTI